MAVRRKSNRIIVQVNNNHSVIKLVVLIGIVFIIVGGAVFLFGSEINFSSVGTGKIVVIPIDAAIYSDVAEGTVELIEKADKSMTLQAIIFEINSPGGTVVASKDVATAVKNAKKPTVALIREVGASGAYWIASATDKIVADPASITGSIGVTGSYLEFSGLMEKYGVGYERLVSGQYKDTGSPYRKLTTDERSLLMDTIDSINSMFINEVATNRNMSVAQVQSVATGQVYLGTQAKVLGLVDVLGGEAEAQKQAEELAGLKSSKLVRWESPAAQQGLFAKSTERFAYWMGKGIGESWNPLNEEEQDALMAELE